MAKTPKPSDLVPWHVAANAYARFAGVNTAEHFWGSLIDTVVTHYEKAKAETAKPADSAGPRAVTSKELREVFMRHVVANVHYWETVKKPSGSRVEGVVFSMLTMIDGCVMGLPAIDLVARPHPDDKAYCASSGNNWIEPGTVINNGPPLHDDYHALLKAYRRAREPQENNPPAAEPV